MADPDRRILDHPPKKTGGIFDLTKRAIVELDGFKLLIMLDDNIGRGIYDHKVHETNVTKAIKETLKPGHTFLDIGANIGYFTMLGAVLVGQTGRVIAVEPNPQNTQLIFGSIKENGFTTVSVYTVAASDQTSILALFNAGSNGGVITETMLRVREPLWEGLADRPFLAQSVRLDDVLANLDRLDVVKIDIEAHEPQALRGMAGLIERHRPIIFTEFHPWALQRMSPFPPENYLNQIQSLGYSMTILARDGSVAVDCSPDEIMSRWRAQDDAKVHFDLRATP